jgi:hypothetical protein
MAMGTSVFRIRIELIFRRCWNLITPLRSAAAALCAAVTQKRGRRAPAPIAPEAQPAKTGGTAGGWKQGLSWLPNLKC